MAATRKQGPRWKTARPPGQRPLPAPDHPEQAAHAAATHREPNHMNRAKRAAPTVLTATSLAEAWPAPADLRPFRGRLLERAKAQITLPIADGITGVSLAVAAAGTIAVLASPRARPHVDRSYPTWSALWVLQSRGHRLGIADHVRPVQSRPRAVRSARPASPAFPSPSTASCCSTPIAPTGWMPSRAGHGPSCSPRASISQKDPTGRRWRRESVPRLPARWSRLVWLYPPLARSARH